MNSKIEQYEAIFELADILTEQTDFNEIVRIISQKSSQLFDSEFASIVMINPRTQETMKTIMEEKKGSEKEKYQLIQTVIIGWVMRNRMSFISTDLKMDSRFSSDIFEELPDSSAMCVPLIFQGRNIGYLTVISNSNQYDEEQIKLLERVSDISAPHISNVQKLQDYFNVPLTNESLLYKYRQLGLLGQCKTFIELLQSLEAAAKCDVRVVLEGETGTGKELVAQALHKLSSRSENPFVAVDCGAIPQNLMESELFGHVKGAFTGANRDRKGLMVEAHHGTLFMDEVNNLSLGMQSKLLRVLQEGEVRPVGSNRKIKLDVRIVAASSLSLSKLVKNEEFRHDLYFRLMVYPIFIPSLEDRKGDIQILADHFLNKFAKEQKKKLEYFHRDINEYLKNKRWAGNIRELENFIERLVTLTPQDTKVLEVSALPQNFAKEINKFISDNETSPAPSLKETLFEYEKEILIKSLEDNNWNQNKVAQSLNLLEQTLRAKMNKFGIVRPESYLRVR